MNTKEVLISGWGKRFGSCSEKMQLIDSYTHSFIQYTQKISFIYLNKLVRRIECYHFADSRDVAALLHQLNCRRTWKFHKVHKKFKGFLLWN